MPTSTFFEANSRHGPSGLADFAPAPQSPTGSGLVPPKPGTALAITDAGVSVAKPIELDDPLTRPASPGQDIGFPYSVIRPVL